MSVYSTAFTLSNILLFVIGFITGILIMFLAIVLLLSSSIRKMNKKSASKEFDDLVKSKKDEFYYMVEEEDSSYISAVKKTNTELIESISSHYFKDSAHPALEITVDETIYLVHYVVSLIRKAIDVPIIGSIKNIRISFIYSLVKKTNTVVHLKAFKIAMNSGISEVIAVVKGFLHVIDPFYWIRKLIFSGSLTLSIKYLCVSEISLLAKELESVYSKELFKKEIEISDDELYSESDEPSVEE